MYYPVIRLIVFSLQIIQSAFFLIFLCQVPTLLPPLPSLFKFSNEIKKITSEDKQAWTKIQGRSKEL